MDEHLLLIVYWENNYPACSARQHFKFSIYFNIVESCDLTLITLYTVLLDNAPYINWTGSHSGLLENMNIIWTHVHDHHAVYPKC